MRMVLSLHTIRALASCAPLRGMLTGNTVVKLLTLWQAKLTNFACLDFVEW